MTKNGKFFTFLFSHSTKSGLYIKKVEVSKSLIQNGLLSLTLIFGVSLFGVGFSGLFNNSAFAGTNFAARISSSTAKRASGVPVNQNAIDYSRPDIFSEYSLNAGGPPDPNAIDDEDSEVEKRLQLILKSGNPAFIPSLWAHMGKINNEFGFRRSPFGSRTYEFHSGIDIDGERGEAVIAPANGVVVKAGWQGGYGNMIDVDHGNGLSTRYGHLSRIEVVTGDTLTRGQVIGFIGSTGRSTGPHLHYELRLNDKPINPRHFLPPERAEIRKVND